MMNVEWETKIKILYMAHQDLKDRTKLFAIKVVRLIRILPKNMEFFSSLSFFIFFINMNKKKVITSRAIF